MIYGSALGGAALAFLFFMKRVGRRTQEVVKRMLCCLMSASDSTLSTRFCLELTKAQC